MYQNDIAIINYGMGNISSVANALTQLNANFIITDNPKDLNKVKSIILPGVGSFGPAMENLQKLGFQDELNTQILIHKKPFLGICLGMQLIAESSAESYQTKGLGWIKGNVIKIDSHNGFVVPHVGWNEVQHSSDSIFFKNIQHASHFFFDHSYHLDCAPGLIAASSHYGQPLVAAVQLGNIFAVQFHPEKSQNNGLRLLRNFMNHVNSWQ